MRYCFDTDVLSAVMRPNPPVHLIRRLARVPPQSQCTTAIAVGELLYGVARHGGAELARQVRMAIESAQAIVPFDRRAAQVFGPLRAQLEREGRPLEVLDLAIASIALARELTLVTGNVRHFERVPGLTVENWLALAAG